uniref:exodeoxyribonuclease III n=1 Tax=Acanthochromis polyacanthus TaxID=80966 RepID=A0A3Q1FVW2_9TELE
MTTLQLASWNTNGLNEPVKRAACLDLLHRNHIDIAFIQESHLKTLVVQRFANRQYHVAAFASVDSKTRGSLIVLKRSLPITILEKFGTEDGRISYIKSIIAGCRIAFISVYAPNQLEPLFFTALSEILIEMHDFAIIMGADMNAVIDPVLDRSGPACHCSHSQSSLSTSLSKFISDFSLIDVFRVINPTVRQYSFYSNRHKTYSRIDYILTSSSISEIHHAAISPTPLSDHSIVLAKLTLPNTPTKAARWHFNTTLVKNEEYCTYFRSEFSKFVAENIGSVGDPRIFWYALKGCIRNISIAFASHLNKSRLAKIDDLENKLTSLELQQQLSFSEARKQSIEVTKTELNSLLRLRAEFLIHKTRRTYYFQGPRPSHLLSLRLKQSEKFTNITAIRSESSQTI